MTFLHLNNRRYNVPDGPTVLALYVAYRIKGERDKENSNSDYNCYKIQLIPEQHFEVLHLKLQPAKSESSRKNRPGEAAMHEIPFI